MQSYQPAVFARSDTLFGVCEALGEDFGFNPFYLRVALGVMMIWIPIAVLAAYAAAVPVVALSRLLVPNPRPATAGQPVAAERTLLIGHNEVDSDLAVAA